VDLTDLRTPPWGSAILGPVHPKYIILGMPDWLQCGGVCVWTTLLQLEIPPLVRLGSDNNIVRRKSVIRTWAHNFSHARLSARGGINASPDGIRIAGTCVRKWHIDLSRKVNEEVPSPETLMWSPCDYREKMWCLAETFRRSNIQNMSRISCRT